ncbi:hypothetical protein [Streptomyces sp. NPDC060194]|uniref:hypothetical protein n=1 Tax=Streptomyces sp. NPDC060194 TaxID=3347069 RepID=UPI0036689AE7
MCTAPSAAPESRPVDVLCVLHECDIRTDIPGADPRDWAAAHLTAHARLAGAPHAAAFCRCRAQHCRLHPELPACQGPVTLALLSSPDGWEAIEACSTCVAAIPGAEVVAVATGA